MKIAPFIDDSIRITDFSSAVKVQGHGFTIQDLKSSLYIGGEKFDDNLFLASISNETAPRRGAIHLPWLNLDLGSFNASSKNTICVCWQAILILSICFRPKTEAK